MEQARARALKIVSLSNSDAESCQGELETDGELSGLGQDQQSDSGKEESGIGSPREFISPDITRKKRSAIIKKHRSPIPLVKTRPAPEVDLEPEVKSVMEDTIPATSSRETTPTPATPDLHLPEIGLPELPQFKNEQKDQSKSKSPNKFMVEAPPAMKDQPKKRRGPPSVRRLPKVHYHRKSKAAEAPMTTELLQDVDDPLDFLAKYCIINTNRLPFYEIIYESIVAEQNPRYTQKKMAEMESEKVDSEDKEKSKKKKSAKKTGAFSEHKLKLAKDTILINHGLDLSNKIGLNSPEKYREKVLYTLDTLHCKSLSLDKQLTELNCKQVEVMAECGRELFPAVCAFDYQPPVGKKKKKGKKAKKAKEPAKELPVFKRGEPIPDQVIVDRLTEPQLTTLKSEPAVRQVNLERERTQEKIYDVEARIHQLEGENLLLHILCTEAFYEEQFDNHRPAEFCRKQSGLYRTLRPDPDYELNVDSLEEALQQINNHLLSSQECKYLYFILNLPGRTKINFRLFSVIAALSEKVTQMDPVIRDLLNKFDYNALDVKMDTCKELFSLMKDDDKLTPSGGAPAANLTFELTAGGLKPEHINYVLSKFNREGSGTFDFFDFVTYIPLFIEIHQRIIKDPLSEEQTL